ncbi:MAG: hypothetical protein JNK75_03455 [Betaproteobacteria bacterium]|nr:hypothetical protein [Betaproteobacteria bacterium]
MNRIENKPPLSPARLIAAVLAVAVAFAALLVPLHRAFHAEAAHGAPSASGAMQQLRIARAQTADTAAVAPPQDWATDAAQAADRDPFGHPAGQDCQSWHAVFGADSLTPQPLGIIGTDAVLVQKIAPPRDARYARLSASLHLARGPPRG